MSDPSACPVLQPVTISEPSFAADYYGQRAGAGLIVTETTNISAQTRGAFIWSALPLVGWDAKTTFRHSAAQ